jgi:hypothetical protein
LDTTPRVTALVDANVRTGDSTAYGRIGVLLSGQTADILGISTTGSGWFFIQLPDGRRGWIAPSVVRADGNVSSVERISPPPRPTPAFTPTPLPTATPLTSANLLITGFQLVPATPTCNQAYNVFINITNGGPQPTLAGGTVLVQDRHTATGQWKRRDGHSRAQSGANYVVVVPHHQHLLRRAAHRHGHHRLARQVPETNEADNVFLTVYVLQRNLPLGNCPHFFALPMAMGRAGGRDADGRHSDAVSSTHVVKTHRT